MSENQSESETKPKRGRKPIYVNDEEEIAPHCNSVYISFQPENKSSKRDLFVEWASLPNGFQALRAGIVPLLQLHHPKF
jgi:hypothetical protein